MLPTEWKKRLVDLNVADLTEQYLEWADYVFISAMVVQCESVPAILKRCKTADVKVVAGGPLFTRNMSSFRLFPLAITLAIKGFHFRQVVELHVG